MAVEAAVAKRLTNLDAASQVFVFVPPPPIRHSGERGTARHYAQRK